MSIELPPPLGRNPISWVEWAMAADSRREELSPIEQSVLETFEQIFADVFNQGLSKEPSDGNPDTRDPRTAAPRRTAGA